MSGRKICSYLSHLVYPLKNNSTKVNFFHTGITCWYSLSLIKSYYIILFRYKGSFLVIRPTHKILPLPLRNRNICWTLQDAVQYYQRDRFHVALIYCKLNYIIRERELHFYGDFILKAICWSLVLQILKMCSEFLKLHLKISRHRNNRI